MRRYLVVANQTLASEVLLAELRSRVREEPSQFYVLVPATHPNDGVVWTEGQVRKATEQRMHEALDRLRAEGFDVAGEVGDASPVRAVGDVLLAQPDGFDAARRAVPLAAPGRSPPGPAHLPAARHPRGRRSSARSLGRYRARARAVLRPLLWVRSP